MIWLSLAFAGGGCEKLDDEEKSVITAYLESEVKYMQSGGRASSRAVKTARKLDKKQRLCGPMEKLHAASLLSTGYDSGQVERAYELTKEAMAGHAHGAIELLPYAYDRFRVSHGLPQRYATMVGYENGRQCLFPVDEAAPDDERASYRLGPLAARYVDFAKSIGLDQVKTYGDLGTAQGICHPK